MPLMATCLVYGIHHGGGGDVGKPATMVLKEPTEITGSAFHAVQVPQMVTLERCDSLLLLMKQV